MNETMPMSDWRIPILQGMGILMGRAFREGVSQNKKVTMRTKTRSWRPLADLQGLSGRTKTTGSDMGPLVEVPAMVRIENEKWIFERISQETLTHLTHRLGMGLLERLQTLMPMQSALVPHQITRT